MAASATYGISAQAAASSPAAGNIAAGAGTSTETGKASAFALLVNAQAPPNTAQSNSQSGSGSYFGQDDSGLAAAPQNSVPPDTGGVTSLLLQAALLLGSEAIGSGPGKAANDSGDIAATTATAGSAKASAAPNDQTKNPTADPAAATTSPGMIAQLALMMPAPANNAGTSPAESATPPLPSEPAESPPTDVQTPPLAAVVSARLALMTPAPAPGSSLPNSAGSGAVVADGNPPADNAGINAAGVATAPLPSVPAESPPTNPQTASLAAAAAQGISNSAGRNPAPQVSADPGKPGSVRKQTAAGQTASANQIATPDGLSQNVASQAVASQGVAPDAAAQSTQQATPLPAMVPPTAPQASPQNNGANSTPPGTTPAQSAPAGRTQQANSQTNPQSNSQTNPPANSPAATTEAAADSFAQDAGAAASLPVKAETSSITLARKPASAALPLGADQIAKSAPDGTSGAQNPQVGAGQQAAQPPVLPPQQLPPAPVQTGDGTGLPGPVAVPPAISPPAAAAVAQSVHVAPQDTATPNFNSLAVEIVAKTQSGAKQFDIRLDPQELGRVEVRLSIDASGKAEAHLSADQPATLDLLQKDAPTLTRALRDAGLDVSQNGLNFSLRGQGGNNGNSGTNGGQSGRRSSVTSLQALKSIDAGAATAAWRGPADGRLDISV